MLRKVKVCDTIDPHLDPDQHQNLIISRGSPLAHAYRVWSTSVNTFVSYSDHAITDEIADRQTNSDSHMTPPIGGVLEITEQV